MPEWPADKVERRTVASLIPYARNARTHSEAQVAQIAASIREWGWTMPVLIDEHGNIIAGHGRVLAARKLGIDEVPVMVAAGWSEAKRRAYVLADNRLAEAAGWDIDLLRVELQELNGFDFDLGLTGFSLDDINSINAGQEPEMSQEEARATLAERFGVPPFTVLNAREGWWQARKSAWIALGIKSELGRGENLLKWSDTILEPDPARRAARFNAQPGRHGRSPDTETSAAFKARVSKENGAKRAAGKTAKAAPQKDAGDAAQG